MQFSVFWPMMTSGLVLSRAFVDDEFTVHHICSSGFFRDSSTNDCKPCSSCPLNHIIRRPCSQDGDTICGHFNEFDHFKQNVRKTNLNDAKGNTTLNSSLEGTDFHDGTRTVTVTRNTSEESWLQNNSWKGISLFMIGLITVLCFLIMGLVLFILYKKRRQQKQEFLQGAEYFEMDIRNPRDPLMIECETTPSNVETSHAVSISSSRERLKATGWLTELGTCRTLYEGSDDSAGSSVYPRSTGANDVSDFSSDSVFSDSLSRRGNPQGVRNENRDLSL